jgi:Icc-related predicted phosphoesterase
MKHDKVVIEPTDVLVSCGDYSFLGKYEEVRSFHKWLNLQPATHKISLNGNHELNVEKYFDLSKQIAEEECPGVHFLEEAGLEIDGIKFWLSAMTPFFHNWAYNRHRGPEIKAHWDRIPLDTQVLVTHGMPYGFLDIVYYADGVTPRERVGCKDLADKITELKDLRIVAGGHLHGSSGTQYHNGVHYINSAICDEVYYPSNPPRIVEI